MPDYTVTPANVLASSKATKQTGVAGEAITAGQVVALASDGSIKLHDANGTPPLNTPLAIALHGALTGQPITYAKADPDFQPGFTLVAGDTVIASATPGGLCPDADKVAGWFVTQMGIASSTTKMKLQIVPSGVAKA